MVFLRNIKKTLAVMVLGVMTMSAGKITSVYAMEQLSLYNNYDGKLKLYVYSSDETERVVNVVNFLNLDTGDEYFFKFIWANYNGRVWEQEISIPSGSYYIYGGMYLDTRAEYALRMKENPVEVTAEANHVGCIIGTYDWIDANEYLLDEIVPVREKVPEVTAEPTPTPIPEPTLIPTVAGENEKQSETMITIEPEKSPEPTAAADPEKKPEPTVITNPASAEKDKSANEEGKKKFPLALAGAAGGIGTVLFLGKSLLKKR